MKKQILEIMELESNKEMIKTQEMTIYYDKSDCASKIADMVKAFTEWKDLETIVQRQTRYTVKYLLLDLDAPTESMTIDELFNYWYANIKDN